jgi:hypothetical protein
MDKGIYETVVWIWRYVGGGGSLCMWEGVIGFDVALMGRDVHGMMDGNKRKRSECLLDCGCKEVKNIL